MSPLACCPPATDPYHSIAWRPADSFTGPDLDGWSLQTSADLDGEPIYSLISYCPWCGTKLPDGPPEVKP